MENHLAIINRCDWVGRFFLIIPHSRHCHCHRTLILEWFFHSVDKCVTDVPINIYLEPPRPDSNRESPHLQVLAMPRTSPKDGLPYETVARSCGNGESKVTPKRRFTGMKNEEFTNNKNLGQVYVYPG